jgi:hypothetical protein
MMATTTTNGMALWKPAYATAMVAAVFSPLNPKTAPIAPIVVVLSVGLLVLIGVLRLLTAQGMRTPAISSFGLCAFFAVIAISLPVALLQGTSARDWLFRGATPLLFLGTYFLLPIRTTDDARFVMRTLLVVCFVWAGKILLTLLADVSLLGENRWTGLAKDLLLPFNVLACAFLFFDSRISAKWRWVGLPLFLVLTVGAGYRSQLLLLGIMVVWSLRSSAPMRRLITVSAMIGLATAGAVVGAAIGPGGLGERFAELGSETESGRAHEIRYAFGQFASSPLFGKGLGFPIPVEVTFAGREQYMRRIASREGNYGSVAYMHNIVMYLLMTTGVLGLSAFVMFVGGAFWRGGALLVAEERRACQWALGLLLSFTLAAATFTLFQYDLLVASLVAVLAARSDKRSTLSTKVDARLKVSNEIAA